MDERLERALSFSNYRRTLENQLRAIKRRFDTMVVLYYGDGMFHASPMLISYIETLKSYELTSSIVLDAEGVPIDIDDLKDFQIQLMSTYSCAMNEYSTEYKKLIKQRNVKGIMDW